MLTWKEFERKNMDKAFEIATRICQERRTKANAWDVHNNSIFTADIFAEMNKTFILDTMQVHRANMGANLLLLNPIYFDEKEI